MGEQNKNLILAMVLSTLVLMLWLFFFPPPEPVPQTGDDETTATDTPPLTPVAPTAGRVAAPNSDEVRLPPSTPKIAIATERLEGFITLQGGRIDSLHLTDYRETLADGSPTVTLLAPAGAPQAFYALYGWAPGDETPPDQLPGPNTEWTLQSEGPLTTAAPVRLLWNNGNGLEFTRIIEVDDNYMFTIRQSVRNTGPTEVRLAPYGVLKRHGIPQGLKNFFILHEGVIGMADGRLSEIDYDEITDYAHDPREGARAQVFRVEQSGWIGFTDHYWMAALIPGQGGAFKSVVKYDDRRDIYQTEMVMPSQTLAAGESFTTQSRLFAGAKEWATIRAYQNQGNVVGFLDSIDWGWFFYLTKPIFALLHWLNSVIGNMGWAIIALTFIIKLIVFPLAYKSYASMARMKELQPEMERLKEAAGEDRQKFQKDVIALYKKEKVNPASGCLPILIQIPIFFSLYKVIFVTIELRHAAWIAWIRDLSAPDPTSILNLFGLLPYETPDPGSLLFIVSLGVLPILLGISMWMQQKLNPAPTDPTQKMVFAWLPWIFMFMLGTFASGLVLYWIANNTITFVQQYLIMRRHGYKPDVFGNIRASFIFSKGADSK